MQGVMIRADNTTKSSTKGKVHLEKRHRRTKQPRDIEIKLEDCANRSKPSSRRRWRTSCGRPRTRTKTYTS